MLGTPVPAGDDAADAAPAAAADEGDAAAADPDPARAPEPGVDNDTDALEPVGVVAAVPIDPSAPIGALDDTIDSVSFAGDKSDAAVAPEDETVDYVSFAGSSEDDGDLY